MSGPLSNPYMFKSAAGATGFYSHEITKSLRANSADDAYLHHTPSGSSTNRKKWTCSFWFKNTMDTTQAYGPAKIFACPHSSTNNHVDAIELYIDSGHGVDGFFQLKVTGQGGLDTVLATSHYIRDPAAWFHVYVSADTTQGTASDRMNIYLNGTLITNYATETYASQNFEWGFGSAQKRSWFRMFGGSYTTTCGGYLADAHFIDGSVEAISKFGESKNGVWTPVEVTSSTVTYGNNGFSLKFLQTGTSQNSSGIGADTSGNDHHFASVNFASTDVVLDTPTNNFCTLNPVYRGDQTDDNKYGTLTEGNLKISYVNNQDASSPCTIKVPASGKWYFEYLINAGGGTGDYSPAAGIFDPNEYTYNTSAYNAVGSIQYANNVNKVYKGTSVAGTYGGSRGSNGDVMGIAVDMDNGAFYVSKNGTFQTISGGSQGDPTSGSSKTGAGATWTPASEFTSGMVPLGAPNGGNVPIITMNFGQDGTFSGEKTAGGNSDTNGYGNFYSAVPSGYSAICSGALTVASEIDPAETDDNFPQKLFKAVPYTGNDGGTSNNITFSFKPDMAIMKMRGNTGGGYGAQIWDTTRGDDYYMYPAGTAASVTSGSNYLEFVSTGLKLDTSWDGLNQNGETYIAHGWRANGGTTSSNSTGDITSTVQVDPSGCFSIVTYTGESATRTIGHGLSSTPTAIWIKSTASSYGWANYFKVNGVNKVAFNGTGNDTGASTLWGNTHPTSSVFTVGDGSETGKSTAYIAYCFAPCEGYISIGSYEGNGNADGAFVYTGHSPAYILVKSLDSSDDWIVYDNKRDGYNVTTKAYAINLTNSEATSNRDIDILSNGFKLRTSNSNVNGSNTYAYIAMAHNPFKYATAR